MPHVRNASLATALLLLGLAAGFSAALFPPVITFGLAGLPAILLLLIMPELRIVPARLARASLFALLFCVMSVPDYFTIIIPGSPWISIRRVVLLTCVISTLLVLAGSKRHRNSTLTKFKNSPVISSAFVTFMVISILSTFQSSAISIAFSTLINQSLLYYIPFVSAVVAVESEQDVMFIMKLMLACTLCDCVLGGVEFVTHQPFLPFALPPSVLEAVRESSPAYEALGSPGTLRNGLYRAASIYITPLSWGEMAAMMAPLAAYFILLGKTTSLRLFGTLGLLGAIASIAFSGSRGAYVGLLAGGCAYLLLWAVREVRVNPKSLLGPILVYVMGLGTLAAGLAVLFVPKVHNIVLGGGAAAASNQGRHEQWALAWPHVFSRPLLGYGPGTGPSVVAWVSPSGFSSLDSYFINLLVSLGIPGFFAFFAFFGGCIVFCGISYVRNKSPVSSFMGSFGCAMIGFLLYRYTLNQVENMALVHILAGTCIAALSLEYLPEAQRRASPTQHPTNVGPLLELGAMR